MRPENRGNISICQNVNRFTIEVNKKKKKHMQAKSTESEVGKK